MRLIHWYEQKYKKRLMRYYKKPLKDDRSKVAHLIDFYGILLLVLLITFIWLFNVTKGIFLPSLACILESFIAWKFKNLKKHKIYLQKSSLKASNLAWNNIKKIKQQQELAELSRQIFKKLAYCQEVNELTSPKALEANPSTAFKVKINNLELLVDCRQDEKEIKLDRINNFWQKVKSLGLDGGIFVTSGTFSEEINQSEIKGYLLRLIDGFSLAKLALETGNDISTIEELEQSSKRKISFKDLLRKQGRRKEYLVASIVMAIMLIFPLPPYLRYFYLAFLLLNLFLYVYTLRLSVGHDLYAPLENMGLGEKNKLVEE